MCYSYCEAYALSLDKTNKFIVVWVSFIKRVSLTRIYNVFFFLTPNTRLGPVPSTTSAAGEYFLYNRFHDRSPLYPVYIVLANEGGGMLTMETSMS